MQKMKIVSRLASFGMALALLVLVAFSLWSMANTQQAVDRAISDAHISDLYDQVRYDVYIEKIKAEQYTNQATPTTKAQFQFTAAIVTNDLLFITKHAELQSQTAAQQALLLHTRYLEDISQIFLAVDANDPGGVILANQDSKPIFDQFQHLVNSETSANRQLSTQSLNALARVQQIMRLTTPITFGIGLLMISTLRIVQHKYQRRLDKSVQDELLLFERAALTDNLTNLGNHRAYQEDLKHALVSLASIPSQAKGVALAIIDIDDLKMINETSGHLQGDRVLTTFAAIIRRGRSFKSVYRLNGDEFAIILPQTTLDEATTLMEQLRLDAEQGLFGATVSIGIASCLPDSYDGDELQEQAHLAVTEAKRRNHNTTLTFEQIREHVSLIAPAKVHSLLRMLSDQSVNVAFQPIWDVEHDRLLAFEALTRPPMEYGFSGPQEAFDIAEKIGRAHELDYICVHAILARAAELPADALLFLNLTPQTLEHDMLTGAILLEAVLSAGLTPERVVLEITERSVVQLDVVVREAQKLRSLGFRLALDDTGAGNSGLEMLSQLAVDFVKIDRAIVVKSLTDATAHAILQGITTMARQMNSYVIAEGIEDVGMLSLVQAVGAHAVQGYLLGRPSQILPSPEDLQALRPSAQEAFRGHIVAAR